MSLIVDIRVNADPIGTLAIRRVTGSQNPDSVNMYRWHYAQDFKERGKGIVEHRYGDGALALVRSVLEELGDVK